MMYSNPRRDRFIDMAGITYDCPDFLTYDDVIIDPEYSYVESRMSNDIHLHTDPAKTFQLDIPLISANMDTITEEKMARRMDSYGGLGILHRFMDQDDYRNMIVRCAENQDRVGFSVGMNTDEYWIRQVIDDCLMININVKIIICFDVANANNNLVIEKIRQIQTLVQGYIDVHLIAGNVTNKQAIMEYGHMGVAGIKVGIGNGAVCQTRLVSGHGVPQFSAVMRAAETVYEYGFTNMHIIADGGIKHPGDVIKAIAAGADSVMIGSMFAGTSDTPGEVNNGYKNYRGQSSRTFMEAVGKEVRTSEGISAKIRYKGDTSDVISDLIGGIRSGMSYANAMNLDALRNVRFIRVSQAGLVEGQTHILNREGTSFDGF